MYIQNILVIQCDTVKSFDIKKNKKTNKKILHGAENKMQNFIVQLLNTLEK